MLGIALIAAGAAGGRFTPVKPTLSYAGSGTSNNGKFTITNYDATYIYTATGTGSVSGNTLTISNANASSTLTARAPKGLTSSAGVIAERKAATQSQVFVATGPFECHGCSSPGHGAPCCAPGPCGCGTFHQAGGFPYTGFWACCEPGYFIYPFDNYAGQGYTWGGSNYTNGQGEWWRIIA